MNEDWQHAPIHRLSEQGTYIITGATNGKQHLLSSNDSKDAFQEILFRLSKEYGWSLQAWAVLSNHYHFVIANEDKPESLARMMQHLHSESAIKLNQLNNQLGRKVWFQYWDTGITFEKSWLARLNYVNQNAVKHGVVRTATEYVWCSAKWFELNHSESFQKTVSMLPVDHINIKDDF